MLQIYILLDQALKFCCMVWWPGVNSSYRVHGSASLWCTDWLGRLWLTLTSCISQSTSIACFWTLVLQAVAAGVAMQLVSCKSALVHVVPAYIYWWVFPAKKTVSQHVCLCNQPPPELLFSTRLPTQCTCACSWHTAQRPLAWFFCDSIERMPFSSDAQHQKHLIDTLDTGILLRPLTVIVLDKCSLDTVDWFLTSAYTLALLFWIGVTVRMLQHRALFLILDLFVQ